MQLGSTVCCSFLSSFPYSGRAAVRFSLSLVPAPCQSWSGGEAPGRAGGASPSPCRHPLLWEQVVSRRAQVGQELLLLCCRHCSPGQEKSGFVSRCELPWDTAELVPGWPCSAQTCAPHRGEIPVGARRSLPGKATRALHYPRLPPGVTDAFFGVLQGQQLRRCEHFDTRLASERGGGGKMAVIRQICPKEVIENKLLPKAKGHS